MDADNEEKRNILRFAELGEPIGSKNLDLRYSMNQLFEFAQRVFNVENSERDLFESKVKEIQRGKDEIIIMEFGDIIPFTTNDKDEVAGNDGYSSVAASSRRSSAKATAKDVKGNDDKVSEKVKERDVPKISMCYRLFGCFHHRKKATKKAEVDAVREKLKRYPYWMQYDVLKNISEDIVSMRDEIKIDLVHGKISSIFPPSSSSRRNFNHGNNRHQQQDQEQQNNQNFRSIGSGMSPSSERKVYHHKLRGFNEARNRLGR